MPYNNDITLLKENGGPIVFLINWAQSLFKRIGFVKRKATTAKVPNLPGFRLHVVSIN